MPFTIGANAPDSGLREAESKILQELEELQFLLLHHSKKLSQISDSMAELQNTWSCTKFQSIRTVTTSLRPSQSHVDSSCGKA